MKQRFIFFAKRDCTVRVVCFALLLLVVMATTVFAAPVSPEEAKAAARNWLSLHDNAPLNVRLSHVDVDKTVAFKEQDENVYYIVYLQQSGQRLGFVAMPADDLVEPVVGFFPYASEYTADHKTPVGALVDRDMRSRVQHVRSQATASDAAGRLRSEAAAKWELLLSLAGSDARQDKIGRLESISDVRVDALLESQWGQTQVGGINTYNIFIPNNYSCGCVATAISQVIRFHEYPREGVGLRMYDITVDDEPRTEWLLGGNGQGGPYDYGNMPLVPGSETPGVQRMAISRLTHDAGLSVNMHYTSFGSGTAKLGEVAFVETFNYDNAIGFYNEDLANIDSQLLYRMLNSSFDAGFPVVLGIAGEFGHAIVADGYGYDTGTMYHHLSMGWNGTMDAWYNLPTIDAGLAFDTVDSVVYNVFPGGKGEIISGRVLNAGGVPLDNVTVIATPEEGGGVYYDVTNAKGIFSFTHVPSATSFTLEACNEHNLCKTQTVSTGTSRSTQIGGESNIGNIWGVELELGGSDQTGALMLLLDGVEN